MCGRLFFNVKALVALTLHSLRIGSKPWFSHGKRAFQIILTNGRIDGAMYLYFSMMSLTTMCGLRGCEITRKIGQRRIA